MNKEDYVSLEVAKLLKEKGFDENCMAFYTRYGLFECNSYINTNELKHPTPTLYEAQKWLREEKCLHVEISYYCNNCYGYDILTIPRHDLIGLADRRSTMYKIYEEALNAGILEALKLI